MGGRDGGKVIEYQDYTSTHVLTCDRCGRHDSVRTAKTAEGARRIAAGFFKWATNTPHGDLCPTCASLWRNGVLERDDRGAG
jgi:hypothetical protein